MSLIPLKSLVNILLPLLINHYEILHYKDGVKLKDFETF